VRFSVQIYLVEERGFLFNITRVGVGSAKAYNATDAVSAILVLNSTMGTISDGIRVCDEVTRGELCIELQPIQGFYPAWALPLCILTPVICLAVAFIIFVALITSMEYRQLVTYCFPPPLYWTHRLQTPRPRTTRAFESQIPALSNLFLSKNGFGISRMRVAQHPRYPESSTSSCSKTPNLETYILDPVLKEEYCLSSKT